MPEELDVLHEIQVEHDTVVQEDTEEFNELARSVDALRIQEVVLLPEKTSYLSTLKKRILRHMR